jgi:hypothetical protein
MRFQQLTSEVNARRYGLHSISLAEALKQRTSAQG